MIISMHFLKLSYQQKSWTDKFPAQPPVKSWLKAHHSLDIVTEAVHTWNEHWQFHSQDHHGEKMLFEINQWKQSVIVQVCNLIRWSEGMKHMTLTWYNPDVLFYGLAAHFAWHEIPPILICKSVNLDSLPWDSIASDEKVEAE